jgi:hypothetical protein
MSAQPVDVLVCGKPLYRTTTHLIVNVRTGRLISQSRSEKAAEGRLRIGRGSVEFADLRILPLAEALEVRAAALARCTGGQ